MIPVLLITALAVDDSFFESKIRPVLAAKCQSCHGDKVQMAGISLVNAEGFAKAKPKLMAAVTHTGKVKMPPGGKLSEPQLADLQQWMDSGAAWPALVTAPATASNHWAFRPLAPGPLTSIDAHINKKLAEKKLAPGPRASKLELLRRVTFDLTGLPPTRGEIDAFLADQSPGAYARLIDRLLASPHYGERWGRHWLDAARFADSTGMDEDHIYPHSWRYRDYVVQAFNDDLPFDRFIKDQIAGDLYPERGATGIVATGFLALGPKPLAQQDRIRMIYDVVDEQIDTTSKAFLGLTIGCARCHDHKFDPIPTADYYGLAGIFASSVNFRALGRPGAVSYIHYSPLDPGAYAHYQAHRWRLYGKQLELEEAYAEDLAREGALHRSRLGEINDPAWLAKNKLDTLKPEERQAKLEKLTTRWEESLANWRRRFATEVVADRALPERPKPDESNPFLPGGPLAVKDSPRVAALRAEYELLKKTLPPEPAMASAVAEGVAVDQRIFPRGDNNAPGDPVAKHFPTAVSWGPQPEIKQGSGRRELAEWLADPRNPLTPRVFVNRVWQWHFGEGLMRTPNNWGVMAEAPSHPELLDFLAAQFLAGGGSLKKLHRMILLSEVYQRGSRTLHREADPANRYLSYFPRLRMSVEQIRDSLLAIDGTLDRAIGGAPAAKERMKPDELNRRTLYTTVKRGSVPALLATFDYGDATTVSEGRPRTNVAPQALFLRNSKFVHERARNLAALLMKEGATGRDRVQNLYLVTLTRPPTPEEIDSALSYVASLTAKLDAPRAWESLCRVLFASNEFIYLP